MMIKLGTGPDAVVIDDDYVVPIAGRELPNATARLRLDSTGVLIATWNGHAASVVPSTGQFEGGWGYRVDILALRREMGLLTEWRCGMPAGHGDWLTLGPPGTRIRAASAQLWTHRPNNTPEKQAAFDAALVTWMSLARSMSLGAPAMALAEAARALGYGRGNPNPNTTEGPQP